MLLNFSDKYKNANTKILTKFLNVMNLKSLKQYNLILKKVVSIYLHPKMYLVAEIKFSIR